MTNEHILSEVVAAMAEARVAMQAQHAAAIKVRDDDIAALKEMSTAALQAKDAKIAALMDQLANLP